MNPRHLAERLFIIVVFFGLFLFLPAGTLAWRGAWVFIGVSAATNLLVLAALARLNPEIFAARRRIQPGTKQWDRILLMFLFVALCAIFLVAGLDVKRFHWSTAPAWTVWLGYGLYLFGSALFTSAQAVNKFFEPGVRIQADRSHHVIDRGPYRIVRHPGYVGACGIFVGTAMALGSLWALVPAACTCLILVIRTSAEDRTLREELWGYWDYARRVRFRWVPGVW
ncbi:isoprenylcysteine carboxylmethyltransferase family protein [Methylovirgula sp. HY1]|uniref:methyltransferase family protein n=1 Tax=Methylovirgula sp. HY1 TaxID=2822761 RepID=UPI001C5BE072|nr:isoprenylcysteine carboxylmethyltransferase family protein [Methylovirgula sp. HY1]QXX74790.1 hypothetical protein MHY1_01607 [Methylovirgula sp. HY1]